MAILYLQPDDYVLNKDKLLNQIEYEIQLVQDNY